MQTPTNVEYAISYDPHMAGAAGDGVTDDSAALQNAVNSAFALGKPLKLSGTYLIRRQGVRLRGHIEGVAGTTSIIVDPNFNMSASFTGSISGTTLTVSAVASGAIVAGMSICSTGVASNTTIAADTGGGGGVGTYSVNISQTVASQSMNGSQDPLTNYGATCGPYNTATADNLVLRNVSVTNKCLAPVSGGVYCATFSLKNVASCHITGGLWQSLGSYTTGLIDSLIGMWSCVKNVTITDAQFIKTNGATSGGGCIWVTNGTNAPSDTVNNVTENVRISNCTFFTDTLDEGVAIWGSEGTVRNVTVKSCTFKRGSVVHSTGFSAYGGFHTIYAGIDSILIDDCCFYDSSFTSSAAQAYSTVSPAAAATNVTFRNCTAYVSGPASGQAAAFYGIAAIGGNNKVINCVVDASLSANPLYYGVFGFDIVDGLNIVGGSNVQRGVYSTPTVVNSNITANLYGLGNCLTCEDNTITCSGTNGILAQTSGSYLFRRNTVTMTGTSGTVAAIQGGNTSSSGACDVTMEDNVIFTSYASARPLVATAPIGVAKARRNKCYGVGSSSYPPIANFADWKDNELYGALAPTSFEVDAGNASINLPPRQDQTVYFDATLSANRTVTLPGSASFTGSISGQVLTVSAVTSGVLVAGMKVTGTGVANDTYITQDTGGGGGAGTYYVNNSQTVSSGTAMTCPMVPNGTLVKIVRSAGGAYTVSDNLGLGVLISCGWLSYLVRNGAWILYNVSGSVLGPQLSFWGTCSAGYSTSTFWSFTQNTEVITAWDIPYTIPANAICIRCGTADNTTNNNYSFALYNSAGQLVIKLGPVKGTTFACTTGFVSIPLTTTAILLPGRYYASFTCDGATGVATLAINQATFFGPLPNHVGAATTGGAPNATITIPADSFANQAPAPYFELHS